MSEPHEQGRIRMKHAILPLAAALVALGAFPGEERERISAGQAVEAAVAGEAPARLADGRMQQPIHWEPPPPSRFQQFIASIGYPGVQYYGMVIFEGGGGFSHYYRPVPADYLIGPGDEMMLRMWGKVDVREVLIVDPEGRVDLPHAGPLIIAGKRLSDAKKAIANAMSRVFTDFRMDVTITRLRTIEVIVTGEVRQPGLYRVGSGTGILQLLTMAGGVLPTGTMRDVQLLRGGQRIAGLDVYDLLMKGIEPSSGGIIDSDIVFVPQAGVQVAVVGGVKRPAIYELTAEKSLREIIALAGGLDFTSTGNPAVVHRLDDTGRLQGLEFPVDGGGYKPVHGDVVVIPEPFSAPARVVKIGGEVERPGSYPFVDGMRLSELVRQAKGLRSNAYLRGAEFFRASVKALQQERLDEAVRMLELRMTAEGPEIGSPDAAVQLQYRRELLSRLKNVRASGRVSIDLAGALERSGSAADITLEPGDTLVIPLVPSTVAVVG
ncbi:MAG TPA: hypothetical protein ENN09_01950, partial [Planctomycetes bacterium]|nr:hypothetical protein [Planctomycetota bacterium]